MTKESYVEEVKREKYLGALPSIRSSLQFGLNFSCGTPLHHHIVSHCPSLREKRDQREKREKREGESITFATMLMFSERLENQTPLMYTLEVKSSRESGRKETEGRKG